MSNICICVSSCIWPAVWLNVLHGENFGQRFMCKLFNWFLCICRSNRHHVLLLLLLRSQLGLWGSPIWVRFLCMWPFLNPNIEVVTFHRHGWCVFVADIHPFWTWMSGSFESLWWNACVHRLDLSLYSHPKEFKEMESEPMLAPRKKSPLSEAHAGQRAQHTTNWAIPAPNRHHGLLTFYTIFTNLDLYLESQGQYKVNRFGFFFLAYLLTNQDKTLFAAKAIVSEQSHFYVWVRFNESREITSVLLTTLHFDSSLSDWIWFGITGMQERKDFCANHLSKFFFSFDGIWQSVETC